MSIQLFSFYSFVFWLFLYCWCFCCLYFSGCCNQSSAFFNVVFESLYQPSTLSSMLLGIFLLLFLKHSLWTSSQGSKAICMVISFLVLWCICWSCSLVQYKNGPEYLTKETAPAFNSVMRFQSYSLVSSSFLWRYSFFNFFFHLHFFYRVRFQYS